MLNKCSIKKLFFPAFLAIMCVALLGLSGCGGGGSDNSSDGGPSYPGYSELEMSFGGVVLNHIADQTVTLKNVGTINLPLGQVEGPNLPFTIVEDGDTCSGNTLTPSETCSIQVRFKPTTRGDHLDGFVVPISGSDQNFVGVNLDGYGWGYNVSINQVETECPAVRLIVSVTDSNDNPVTGLDETDFKLYEDDAEIQWGSGNTIFNDVVTNPDLSVILLIDTSGSVADVLDSIKAAAKVFIDDMNSANQVAIFRITATGGESVQDFILANEQGKDTLDSVIDSINQASGDTALYQAVLDASAYMGSATPGNRHVIVLITDGQDTSSPEGTGLDEAIAAAQQAGVPLFTIGFGVGDDYTTVLSQLADDTGGQAFLEPDVQDLGTVYGQVSNILSNQYEITYNSTSCGGATISLEVVDSGDSSVVGEDTREF